MSVGIGGPPRRPDPLAQGAVKEWVRAVLDLSPSTTVVVSELACREEGCPPVETVIGVLDDGEQRRWTLHKTVVEITETDVRRALGDAPV